VGDDGIGCSSIGGACLHSYTFSTNTHLPEALGILHAVGPAIAATTSLTQPQDLTRGIALLGTVRDISIGATPLRNRRPR